MTTLHKAAQAALEALEHCREVIVERGLNGNEEFAAKWSLTLPLESSAKAINDLRAALAQEPARQAGRVTDDEVRHMLASGRAKLAQFHAHFGKDSAPLPAVQEPDCRIELVTAIHFLASDFENSLYKFGNDTEALQKAKGDIAHARSVAAKFNWNGTSTKPPKDWTPPYTHPAQPAQPDRSAELKSWSLLAARALDDCHRVIETIVAESSTEEEKLNELDKRVYELFNQALCLHGLMTRTQLDKVTGFGRVEVTGPIDKPAVQEPERVPPIGFTWIDFHRELQGAQWAAITPGWTQALEMVCKRLLELDAAQQAAAHRAQVTHQPKPRTDAVSGLEFCELPPTPTGADDPLYAQAVKVVRDSRMGSISRVQRELGIRYHRAATMLEAMEREGIISPWGPNGTGREVAGGAA